MRTIKYFAMTLAGAFLLSNAAMAQDDGGDMNKKGKSGDISIGFNYDLSPNINVGSFLGGGGAGAPSPGSQWRNDAFGNAQIFGRYYLSDDLAIRAGLGLNSNSSETISKDSSSWAHQFEDADGNIESVRSQDSSAFSKTTVNSSQFNFSIAPGIEKHISTNSNIDPYVGAQIPIAILGKTSVDSTISRTGYDQVNENETSYDYSSSGKQPGGFGWGIQGILGFNWFVDDKVAIGMEYKLGFMNTSQGGEWTRSIEREGQKGNTTFTDESEDWSHQDETSNGGLQTMSRGGINVSIFF